MSELKRINLSNPLTINADIFIIPNRAARIKDLILEQERTDCIMRKICELNGAEFNPETDCLLECWYLSEELGCDNIPDHNIVIINEEDGETYVIVPDSRRKLPSSLFRNHREGDVVTLKIPMHYHKAKDSLRNTTDTIATVNFTLSQTKYRYQKFGNFQEVFRKVVQ